MITIIGLGTRAGELSLRAVNCLKEARCVLVRAASLASARALKELDVAFESLDFVYEKSRNFDTLAKNLAAEVRKRAAEGDVCDCVDGGVTEDRAAQLLLKQGGVTVCGQKVADIEARFSCKDCCGEGAVIRKGKKVYHKAVLEEQ